MAGMLIRCAMAIVMLTGCSEKDCKPAAQVPTGSMPDPGGCTIIKVAPTGEYVTALLSKFGPEQAEVCERMIEDWNRSPYLRGAEARFRCNCPVYQPSPER